MLNKKHLDAEQSGQFFQAASQYPLGGDYAEAEILRLFIFFRTNPNPLMVFSPTGEVIKVNPAAERLLNRWQIEQSDLLPEAHLQIVRSCLAGQREYRVEVAVKQRVFALTYHALPSFKLTYLYVLDITEYRQAEEEFLLVANSTIERIKRAVMQIQGFQRSLPKRVGWRQVLLGADCLEHRPSMADLFVAMDGCAFSTSLEPTKSKPG
jgi:hypothetical protein